MSDSDKATVRNRAVALLARREHGQVELARKLVQKGFDLTVVNQVLAELIQDNLLSDERFVESFVHSHVSRGQGPLKIQAALAQKGVDDSLIDTALAEAGTDWAALACEVRRKRFKDAPPDDYAEKARQARFLSGRGFASSTIWRVLGE